MLHFTFIIVIRQNHKSRTFVLYTYYFIVPSYRFIDYSQNSEEQVNSWISKWTSKGVINNNWKMFITPTNSTPGEMYGLVKTLKVNNPVRVITSRCNTAIESSSIYIEHFIFELSEDMPSRIKTVTICPDHICPAHAVVLQCLNFILQLYNIIFSLHSRKYFEIIF